MLTAAQHANNPAKQDDGHSHAYEPCSHPLQIWRGKLSNKSFTSPFFKALYLIFSLHRHLIIFSIQLGFKHTLNENRQKNTIKILQIHYNNHVQSVASITSALFTLWGKSAISPFSMALFLDSSIVCAWAGVKSARRNEHYEWLWLAGGVSILSFAFNSEKPRVLSQPFFWFMWLH